MPEERKALSFEEFKEGLKEFDRKDFEKGSLPYEYLRDYTYRNPILYKQFMGLLLERAKELEAQPDIVEEQTNMTQLQLKWGNDTILRIAYEIEKLTEKPAEMILGGEEEHDVDETEEEGITPTVDYLPNTNPFVPGECSKKVDVLPLMCGAGKSTAISYIIDHAINDDIFYSKVAEALEQETAPECLDSLCGDPEEILANGDHYGILVVTDRIKRLEDYQEPHKGYYGLLSGYIDKNKNKICFMTSDTIKETEAHRTKRPVLLISAQRYFSCSVSEINDEFLVWLKGQRNLVIFDEEPSVKEYVAITSTSLNDVDSAFSDGIKDTANKTEKSWCIAQWERVEAELKNIMRRFEENLERLTETPSESNCVYTYYPPTRPTLTEDDHRFFEFVRKNKRELCFFKEKNCHSTIRAVYKAITCGAVFTSMKKKDGIRTSAFGVVLDNTAKLTDINAHAVVLDGTAETSPMYDPRYFTVHRDLGEEYRRSLNNLHLKFVDASTSKARLKGERASEEMKALVAYLNRDNKYHGNIPIFSYMFAEDMFVDPQLGGDCDLADHQGRIAHFGGIKGRNDFHDRESIAQIGLFLKPPMYYLAMALSSRPELIERFKSMSPEESSLEIHRFAAAHDNFERWRTRDLLTDTEQNMFRGAIRNPNSSSPYTYYVFTSSERNPMLISMAKARYWDADIEEVPEPFELGLAKIRARKTATPTHAQLVVSFWDHLEPGQEFTVEQLLEKTNMTQGQFDKVKENNRCVQDLFDYYRVTPGGRTYRKPERA